MNYNSIYLFILLGVLMDWGGIDLFSVQFYLIYACVITIAVVNHVGGFERGKRFKQI